MRQQQYANAYVHWDFGYSTDDVWNIDQQIWIAKKASGTQWALVWKWLKDPSHGGYLALQTDDTGQGKVLFSLWNADAAIGDQCVKFSGEGAGYSCRLPFTIQTDRFYRLRINRANTDSEGQWWGAWIIEETPSGTLKEHFLGQIRVAKSFNLIRGNSIENFSEYYGRALPKCCDVPMSVVGFISPAANYYESGTGIYGYYSKFNGGSDPNLNPCKDGNESAGVLFKIDEYDFSFAKGALVFIGGKKEDHKLATASPYKSNEQSRR